MSAARSIRGLAYLVLAAPLLHGGCVSSSGWTQPGVGDRGGQFIEIRQAGIGRSGYRATPEMEFVAETSDGPLSFQPRDGRAYLSFYRPGPLRVSVQARSGHHWLTNELHVEPGDIIVLYIDTSEAEGCIAHREDWTGRCR